MPSEIIDTYLLLEDDGYLYLENGLRLLLYSTTIGELIDITVSDCNNTPSIEVSDGTSANITTSDYNRGT